METSFLDARGRCLEHGVQWLAATDLGRIREGVFVQLQHGPCRLWARVACRQGNHFTGSIVDPPADGRLRFGKAIRFETRHVIQIL